MRTASRSFFTVALVVGAGMANGASWARAQGFGSLGGYGAASTYANPAMAGSGPVIIPYGGMFEGFMPSRMGGGSALSFRPRANASMTSVRSSFSLAPMSGGMGRGDGGNSRMMPSLEGAGMGLGGVGLGGMPRRPVPGGTSVMPPSIGYPFRQPPSLLSPGSSGAGMSM
jgi:hypothetical protein